MMTDTRTDTVDLPADLDACIDLLSRGPYVSLKAQREMLEMARDRIAGLEGLLRAYAQASCPVCFGDCASANPPVPQNGGTTSKLAAQVRTDRMDATLTEQK